MAKIDGPVLVRLYQAWQTDDIAQIQHWNDWLLSCRETMELQVEDQHLGMALGKVLDGLELNWSARWGEIASAYITPYGLAATAWKIPLPSALSAYFWSWLENQVLAAIKLVPLGQLSGQRMLFELAKNIPDYVENSLLMEDQKIGGSLPMLAIASSRHETQYTRLFRS